MAASRRPVVAGVVVPALDAVVEGSWIALVYSTVQVALSHSPAALGPVAFAATAGLGLAWARSARGRLAGTSVGVLIALAAGLTGWLADPAARAALALVAGGTGGFDAFETAVTTNAAGWLLGLAFVRGASHRARARDEERTGRLLERILLLAIPWALGLAFAGDDRTAFVAQATVCTLLFVGAGLLAVGLGRLETYGVAAGVDWRQNRSWVAVVALVVALMLAVSLPAAFLVGAPPLEIVDAAWVPLAAVVGLAAVLAGAVGAPFVAGFEALLSVLPTPQATPLPSASVPPVGVGDLAPVQGDPRLGLTLTILALVALSILLVALVSRIRAGAPRAGRTGEGLAPVEERSIERPRLQPRLPAIRLPRRHRTPVTAAEAYLALLDDLDDDAVLARRASETPRAHAARLAGRPAAGPGRGAGRESVAAAGVEPRAPASGPSTRRDLRLLVADWELSRYARRRLTAQENARGVARWRRLRVALRRDGGAPDGRG